MEEQPEHADKPVQEQPMSHGFVALEQQMEHRCIMYGCIYGNPATDKKPKDNCIYCGRPRKPDFHGFSIVDSLTQSITTRTL